MKNRKRAPWALMGVLYLGLGAPLAARDAEAQSLPFCGDGVINQFWEQCDDGNGRYNDGCSNQCRIETWVCGDGVREGTEVCDDGNVQSNDGCSANCEPEHGFNTCGDGVLEYGEQCDDGNTTPNDGCNEECRREYCGDRVHQTSEACEPRTRNFLGQSTDPCCATDCTLTALGAEEPVISCNDFDIVPSDAPISFTATAESGCWDVDVEVVGSMCSKVNGSGRLVDKRRSCIVGFGEDTFDITDSGGVGDVITWTVEATDAAGNVSSSTCSITVLHPNH